MINGTLACFHINAEKDWPEGSTDRLWSDESWCRGAAGQPNDFVFYWSQVSTRSRSYLDASCLVFSIYAVTFNINNMKAWIHPC